MSIVNLFGGADLRCEELRKAIKEAIYERGMGMPIPSIIGVIEIVKNEIYQEQNEVNNG